MVKKRVLPGEHPTMDQLIKMFDEIYDCRKN